ncbi:MAG: hypothetical protein HQK76_10815 [Desulfobacterales bacterium]|nr:hypothetical protein [Desulfobacterales bacterium]
MFKFREFVVFLILVLLLPSFSFAMKGGPDSFGYVYVDNEESGQEPFEWDTLKKETYYEGEMIKMPEDQISPAIPLGFTFNFYGKSYNQVYIVSNGFITFSSNSRAAYNLGTNIPQSGDNADNLAAGFWADLNTQK